MVQTPAFFINMSYFYPLIFKRSLLLPTFMLCQVTIAAYDLTLW